MYKVLAIEDDSSLARGIQFALEKEGLEVILSGTIAQGEKLIKLHQFDLILLDVMLPDGSGFELCKKVRNVSDIPIIFLTACDEEVNVVLGLDIGADDYITKPFRVRELVSRIRATLRRSEMKSKFKNNNSIIKSSDLVLYNLDRKLKKGEEEIPLTSMEYKLMAMFMQNPLQTLSRNVILEKLWDVNGEFIDDNTLSVYIRRLREKIEDDPSKPKYIITIRGMGYKWNQGSN